MCVIGVAVSRLTWRRWVDHHYNLHNLTATSAQVHNTHTNAHKDIHSHTSCVTGVPQTCLSHESSPAPISPVFRTGSEPLLSPAASCRARPPSQSCLGGSPLRGSDGQLHSRAPPKPLRISILVSPASSGEPDPVSLYGELVPQVRLHDSTS